MISLEIMASDQFDHCSKFSFEKFIYESAKSSGKDIDEIRLKIGGPPNRPTEHDLWYSILSDGSCIGFLWIQLHPIKKEAFIYDFYVETAYRSQGLGRRTMESGIQLMKKRSIEKLKLCVFHDNSVARKLYFSLGFKETDFNTERRQYTLELQL